MKHYSREVTLRGLSSEFRKNGNEKLHIWITKFLDFVHQLVFWMNTMFHKH
jgi:hypothetical protein